MPSAVKGAAPPHAHPRLESHVVLRVEDRGVQDAASVCDSVGLSGNLLLSRLVGARTWLVTKTER